MNRFFHMFRLAAPLLAGIQIIALAVIVIPTASSLMHAERSGNVRTATLGDGVDELAVRLAPMVSVFKKSTSGFGPLFAIAVASLLISSVALGTYVRRIVGGFSDAGALIRHVGNRIRYTRKNARHHIWGVVRDAQSARVLPCAKVLLTTADGTRNIAHTIADVSGRYGFGISPEQAAHAGLRILASKSGYYFPSRKQSAGYEGVYMDRAGFDTEDDLHGLLTGDFGTALSGVAFWASVITVPLVAMTLPHTLGILFGGSLAVTAVARIAGLRPDAFPVTST